MPLSSQLAEPLWTDPSMKSGNSVRELISTSNNNNNKNSQVGNEWSNILPKSSQARKKPPQAVRGVSSERLNARRRVGVEGKC